MLNPNGDPKVTLRLTVLIALIGMIVTGSATWAGTYFGVKSEIRDARVDADHNLRNAMERHMTTPHPDSVSRAELKEDLKEIKSKLDRLAEDVAVLKEKRK